jgi:hypothetical protein
MSPETMQRRREGRRRWTAANKERVRASRKRLRRIPGTHEYNEAHGIGIVGERKRLRIRRWDRKQATERDLQTLRELLNDQA